MAWTPGQRPSILETATGYPCLHLTPVRSKHGMPIALSPTWGPGLGGSPSESSRQRPEGREEEGQNEKRQLLAQPLFPPGFLAAASVHSQRMHSLQRAQAPAPAPAQAQACWIEVALGVFPLVSPTPPPKVKSREKDINLLWELVIYSFSLCGSATRKTFRESLTVAVCTRPAPGRRQMLACIWWCPASIRLIYIFPGGGWAAASSPGQCVN